MSRIGSAVIALLWAIVFALPAFAQQGDGTVRYTGTLTKGHAYRIANPNGLASDAGGAAGSDTNGAGYISELGITNPGLAFCMNDALTSNTDGYHALCFGPNPAGTGALISYKAYGGASELGCTLDVNGTVTPCAGTSLGPMISGETLGWATLGDNTAALAATMARTDSPIVVLSAGTYSFSTCPSETLTAASSVSIMGAGQKATRLRLPAGCTFTSNWLLWDSKSGVSLSSFTLDLNTPVADSVVHNVFSFFATTAAINGIHVHDMSIINGKQGLDFLVPYSLSFPINNLVFENNYLEVLNPIANTGPDSAAIAMVQGNANINHPVIRGNTVIGTVIQIAGQQGDLTNNDISGQGGAAVYGLDSNTTPPLCYQWNIIGNSAHDSVSTVYLPAFELHCPNSLVEGNQAWNNGGAGFFTSANYTKFIGNTAWDNGKAGASTPFLQGATSGFWTYPNPANSQSDGHGLFLSGNIAYDSGAGTQLYGLDLCCDLPYPVTIQSDNQLSGVTGGIYLQSGGTVENAANAGWIYRSKQTALLASVAALQFTGLDTVANHEWRLSCHDVIPASSTSIYLQVGEGATPTWKTASSFPTSYVVTEFGAESSTPINVSNGSLPGIPINSTDVDSSSVGGASFSFAVGDLGVTGNKVFRLESSAYFSTSSGVLGSLSGNGWWAGDGNAITALRIIAGTGNIKGSCVLEGRP